MDPEIKALLQQMRKLERQAKSLIYKMERIEASWDGVKAELKTRGKEVSHRLGDVLHGFQRKSLR